MKKALFILSLFAFSTIVMPVTSLADPIHFRPWINPKPGHGKAPILSPSVSIEGYTLYIDDAMESTFLLIPEGEADPVCTLYAPDGTAEVQIPNDLEGTFTILLIRGSLTFEAVIELEAEP